MAVEPRDWSVISREQLLDYLASAEQLVQYADRAGIHPFAAALAGVSFIRTALNTMGGKVEWWIDFVRTGFMPRGPGPGRDA